MLLNYYKIVLRNLLRNKGYSAINITGLAVGMAAAILILLWVQNELSYDQFHTDKNRIYSVWNRLTVDGEVLCGDGVSDPTGPAIEKDVPGVELAVRLKPGNIRMLSIGEKKLMQAGMTVDPGFLRMFTFPLLKGNISTALNDPRSIVLTETTAKNLFGDEDAMGKIVKIDSKENLIVTGILKDVPKNTHFGFAYLLPWSSVKYREGQDLGWNDNSTPTFVMLKPGVSFASVTSQIKLLKQKYSSEAREMNWELFIYPLSRWRLYSNFTNGVEDGTGRITMVKLFAIIAGFILFIACINFMNLSTARSEKRAKEVGVRKVVGAAKSSLIGQFIGESICVAFLAGLLALIIVLLSLPAFNQFTEKELMIDFGSMHTWLALIGFILFTGLLAGSYPAFFLSSFRPVVVLKGSFKKSGAPVTPLQVLVVLQFTFAIILIVCTIVVKRQIDYASNRETGYNKNNLVYHIMTGDIEKNYSLIKRELLSAGIAKSVTKTNSPLTERWSNGWGQNWEGKDSNDKTSFDRYMADEHLGATAGLQFVQGRDFDLEKYPTDSTGLIINQSSLKLMKFKDPIGKTVEDLGIKWHIVGVVKDFILTSPYEPTRPILICGAKSGYLSFAVIQIRLNEAFSVGKNLKQAEAIFKKYNPDYPFEYKFIDEAYARKFKDEKHFGTLSALFAGLTIFISCLGLFGLATYMAENRIKEIGVRKVLGASVLSIAKLLSVDFIKLVLIAIVIASPVAWYAMYQWLLKYEYHTEIQWGVFAASGGIAIVMAALTVSHRAFKAAVANPVKSLRNE